MARERFEEWAPSADRRVLVDRCNAILTQWQRDHGLRLTLRQLYYQLVMANVIRNHIRSYKNLVDLIAKARMAGLVDWARLEDRLRRPDTPGQWSSPVSLARLVVEQSFRLPRRENQPRYIEVWVEKDALSGVLGSVCDEEHVTLMVNRGYSSLSAMYEASKRFIRAEKRGKECYILYLGDHDPSGEDMVRDVQERLNTFTADVKVQKIALTMDQIAEHDLPPNPAKMTDSRAEAYVAEHGDGSWELDALPPDVLQQITRDAIHELTDARRLAAVVRREGPLRDAFTEEMRRMEADGGEPDDEDEDDG